MVTVEDAILVYQVFEKMRKMEEERRDRLVESVLGDPELGEFFGKEEKEYVDTIK